jgi:hypothetical protein
VKEFITAAYDAAEDENEYLEFTLRKETKEGEDPDPGRLCKAYRPGDGQIAVLMATTQARHLSEGEMIAGIINFFVEILDEETHQYIVSRLLDRRDPFGIDQVQGIIRWLMEEWSGRPTQSSSGSTASPQSDGPTSTPPTPQSTSSGSPFIASATSSGSGAPIV